MIKRKKWWLVLMSVLALLNLTPVRGQTDSKPLYLVVMMEDTTTGYDELADDKKDARIHMLERLVAGLKEYKDFIDEAYASEGRAGDSPKIYLSVFLFSGGRDQVEVYRFGNDRDYVEITDALTSPDYGFTNPDGLDQVVDYGKSFDQTLNHINSEIITDMQQRLENLDVKFLIVGSGRPCSNPQGKCYNATRNDDVLMDPFHTLLKQHLGYDVYFIGIETANGSSGTEIWGNYQDAPDNLYLFNLFNVSDHPKRENLIFPMNFILNHMVGNWLDPMMDAPDDPLAVYPFDNATASHAVQSFQPHLRVMAGFYNNWLVVSSSTCQTTSGYNEEGMVVYEVPIPCIGDWMINLQKDDKDMQLYFHRNHSEGSPLERYVLVSDGSPYEFDLQTSSPLPTDQAQTYEIYQYETLTLTIRYDEALANALADYEVIAQTCDGSNPCQEIEAVTIINSSASINLSFPDVLIGSKLKIIVRRIADQHEVESESREYNLEVIPVNLILSCEGSSSYSLQEENSPVLFLPGSPYQIHLAIKPDKIISSPTSLTTAPFQSLLDSIEIRIIDKVNGSTTHTSTYDGNLLVTDGAYIDWEINQDDFSLGSDGSHYYGVDVDVILDGKQIELKENTCMGFNQRDVIFSSPRPNQLDLLNSSEQRVAFQVHDDVVPWWNAKYAELEIVICTVEFNGCTPNFKALQLSNNTFEVDISALNLSSGTHRVYYRLLWNDNHQILPIDDNGVETTQFEIQIP